MPFSGRVVRLVVVAAVSYQLAHTVDSVHFYYGGPARPFEFQFDSVRVSAAAGPAAQAGIRPGDTVLALNGHTITHNTQLDENLRELHQGDSLRVSFAHPGGPPLEAVIPLASAGDLSTSWTRAVAALFTDFATRWLCLCLGLFVVVMRPGDPLAWLVLAMMLSFSNLASGFGDIPAGWTQPFKAIGVWYAIFLQRSWPLWMLLFGVFFPDPARRPRLFGWGVWLLGGPIFFYALANAFLQAAERSGVLIPPAITDTLGAIAGPVSLLGFLDIGLFFFALQYKLHEERDADARRRLRLLFWGANVSLTPIFLLIVYTAATKTPMGAVNPFVMAAVVLMLFLFPLTLAYVLVVERAMDLRVVLRQGLQYALAQRATRILTGMLLMGLIYLTVEALSQQDVRRPARLQIVGLCVFSIVVLQRGAGKAREWIDRRFFREQVETEHVLAQLGEEVRHITDPEELKRVVCRRISDLLHVPDVRITAAEPTGPGLALPLTVGTNPLGHLVLGSKISEEPYSGSDRRLLQTVANQTALALENARLTSAVAREAAQRERITRELEIAREVQERLFPNRPPQVDGIEYAGRCRPAQSIGGDYYDFFLTSEGRLIVALGDICGKGVPAALLMASLQASLRGLCAGGVNDLAEIMGHLNRLVFDATPRNRFATLWCGVYDPQTRLLQHCSAGQGDALIVRGDGTVERAGARGLALGLTRVARYSCGSVQLAPGDLVAVCTDGVTEAHNPAGEEFGDERWQWALVEANGRVPAAVLDGIIQKVDDFAAGAEQHDDITVLALRIQS